MLRDSKPSGSLAAAIAAGAVTLTAAGAQAATITVNSIADNTTAGDAQCTLREALANANANADTTGGDCVAGSGADTINLTALAGTITLGGTQLTISDSTTLTGPGASTLTIDAASNSRVFYIYNNATALTVSISGLTATRGRGATGGNIVAKGEIVTLNGVTLSGGVAATAGGGVANVGGSLTVRSSTISGNTVQGVVGGAAIYNVGGALTVDTSVITSNSASSLAARAGAIAILSTTQPASITNTQITNNTSVAKGAAFGVKTTAAGGTLTIDHSVITGNTATGRGGAFFLYRSGGAITLSHDQINNNTTQNRGGAIFLYNASANVTISDTTISGNTAPTAAGNGGGIFFYKGSAGTKLSIQRSTISGNSVNRAGGGIFFYKGSAQLEIEDSTIANNTAGTTGGGIFDRGPFGGTASIAIGESTITGNSAGTSGGNLSVTAVPMTIDNTIVANGTAPASPDMASGASNVTMNYSLLENTSGATFTGTGNITGVDPSLGPLQDNGGPTFTQRPNIGSPVLDAGDPSFTPPPSTDQRGLQRVYNGRIDIGSLEQGAMSSISFSTAGATISEGAGSVTVTVNRGSGEGTASVNYSTSNGTAQAGADYTATSGTLTWGSGDFTPKSFTIPILEEAIFEGNEFFNVTLSAPSNATLAAPAAETVTIADNDPQPALSINGVSQAEGNSGTTSFPFVVSLSNPSAQTVTVNYTTVNGTAIAGSDYTAQSGTLTFAPGTTVQTIPVSVLGDALNEASETFTVTLSSPTNATIATTTGTGTIGNDDPQPSLSIGSVAKAEGNSGSTSFVFPVTLSAPSGQTVTVAYATASGSATAGSDYTTTSGTLTFTPGTTAQNITVPVTGDTTNETNETFTVTLSAPTNATIGTATGTGTIDNDDAAPAVSVGDVTQAEGNSGSTSFVFPVTLSAASEQTVTVNYLTSDGSAVAGSDYTAASGTVTFAPGVTSQSISVAVVGDTTKEPSETFTVTLSAPSNAMLGTASATGTIVDDDSAPVLAIGNVSQAEGNSGTTTFSFPVTLSAPSGQTVTVSYATANGSAVAGSDYGATSGTLTFAPGVTSQTVNVPVTGDLTNEADETFTVTLSSSTNAAIATATGTGTIVNDDAPPLLSIDDASQPEGNSGSASMPFAVTLSTPSEQSITVNYTTSNGSAVAGSDYTATSGTLTFAPGATVQSINVPISGDTTAETNETFTVTLSAPSNAAIGDGNATGTIVNDDSGPVVSISGVSQAEGSGGTSAFTFNVTLSQASEETVTVNYLTSNGSAIAGSDYTAASGTLTFAPGVTSQTVTVTVIGDTTSEPDEMFSVMLSAPVNASVGTASATGTIVDDDTAPVLVIGNVSQSEGTGGSTTFTFPVSLSAPSGQTVTVHYATADGSAGAGSDYGATSGTLTFAPGVTTQTVDVPVTGDATNEANETFTVNLSASTNAAIATATGTGTIVNDDPVPSLSIAGTAQAEGNSGLTNMPFVVTLSAASEQTVTVNYLTNNGSAIAGSDYTATSGTLTFAPGVTSQTIDVPIAGDTTSETDETFTVTLGTPSNAAIAVSSATGTIVNDDAGPVLSIDSVSQAEGNSGTSNFTFNVTLSAPSERTITVQYATADGSATAGSDYVATSGTVAFAPGVTSQNVVIAVNGDTANEPAETFSVTLSSPVNATIGTASGSGTIVDDDGAPVLAIGNVSQAEGNSGTTTFSFPVTLSAPSGQTVTVQYATANGSAVAGSDYGATSGTLTFAPGVTSQNVDVPVTGDLANEGDETFTVTLSSSTNAAIATTTGTGTIVNDDGGPTVTIADASQAEGDSGSSNLSFAVTLSAPSEQTVTVSYATANGTATAGSDYTTTSGLLTFAPGVTAQTIDVPVIGDTNIEPDETLSLQLSGATNATIIRAQATGTILNDDGAVTPAISVSDVSVLEGSAGTTPATFTVTLSVPTTQTVTVHYTTTSGSAQAGADFAPTQGTLVFAPGTTSQTVTVGVVGDTDVEANETFTLDLSAPAGATIARARGTATIVNDDYAAPPSTLPALRISDVRVAEGDRGLSDATIVVTLSAPSATDVTADFSTADGTATAGVDYAATSGSVVVPAGTLSRAIHVPIVGDTAVEGDETFHVRLSGANGATIASGDATVTIVNDDAAATETRAYIAVAGATPGAFGSFFRTTLQLHNDSDAAASGSIVFHLMTGGTPATVPYTLAPHETKVLDDAALSAGIGTADVVAEVGALPLAVVRITSTSPCGTVGLATESLDPVRDALTVSDRAILLAPSDLGTSRFNIGVRAIGHDATLHLTLRDRSGNVKTRVDRQFDADTLVQVAASDLLGVAVAADDSVLVEVTSGTAIVYASTTDNSSQDPAIQLARPLP
ncbi:MAG: right-handed parallel beta-helix repeat-containing protein [Acidobacteria bacterium]|nr:right-handed parallel beta-helix repeat-containing protein [Acidobacteriota bacterium]MBV9476243.1 right-handed parallel beta-helix repeat-containing protein [Acidobacteriota bacterium]